MQLNLSSNFQTLPTDVNMKNYMRVGEIVYFDRLNDSIPIFQKKTSEMESNLKNIEKFFIDEMVKMLVEQFQLEEISIEKGDKKIWFEFLNNFKLLNLINK